MPTVIFHASGPDFDPSLLSGTGLNAYNVHVRGQTAKRGRRDFIYEDSGFSIDLGPDDRDDLGTQIQAAIQFLEEYREVIRSLPNLEDLRFDFGYSPRPDTKDFIRVVQCDYLPPDFLKACGELNIAIELSLYPPLSENKNEG